MPAIKPFIAFDMGNVLLLFDHMRACRMLGLAAGLSELSVYSRLFGSGLARRYELGLISSSEFIATCRKVLDLHLEKEQIATAWSDIFVEDEKMRDLVRSLLKKTDLCLVSNTSELHFQWVSKRFPVISAFPRKILSYQVHAMKPDSAIYFAAARFVSPGQFSVYIDDIPEYAAAAEAHGFHSIHFTGHRNLLLQLEKLLIL